MAVTARNTLIVLILVAGLCNPPELPSCAFWIPEAIFTSRRGPEQAPDQFARGSLGVLQPTYTRFYLIIAYRFLSGAGLSEAERKAVFRPPVEATAWSPQPPDAVSRWLSARNTVPGAGPLPRIEVYKQVNQSGYFLFYLNCNDDAFVSAAGALEDRIRRLGAGSAEVKAWVAAQDQVFANCAGGPAIPGALDANAGPSARADRTYQIAAANFYSGDLEKSEAMFREIADDAASPWNRIAPYLVARTLVREATLGVQGEGFNNQKLGAAEAQLEGLLEDAASASIHPAAKRLLDYVRIRLHPDERMLALSRALLRKDSPATIQQNLTDFRYLYDQFEGGKFGGVAALPKDDDLTDWLRTFQASGRESLNHAIEKWRAMQTLPWLIAALSKANGSDPAAPDLLAAAAKIGPDSPGYATAEFHAIRLLIESKRLEEARSNLDRLLQTKAGTYPVSAVNLFRAGRMKVARNWEEFLNYAPRTPASLNFGAGEIDMTAGAGDLPKHVNPLGPVFDVDSVKVLNEQIPLDLLVEAAGGKILPNPLRRELAKAAWVRAVLLDRESTASRLVPILEDLAPELKPSLESYLKASDSRARKFAAVWLMLKFPGMRPTIPAGYGRLTPDGRLDHLRDNWWCPFRTEKSGGPVGVYTADALISPVCVLYREGSSREQFLSPAQREQAGREWLELTGMPGGPDYLAAQSLEWIKAHPNDSRAPEALHIVVQATRYGCAGPDTVRFSEQAFRLLHKQYPNSEWARKTKYWYGPN